jgi:mannan endo-1,4-beta-mannosidase
LGGWDDPPPSIGWIFDIAAYIKSLAPNTLIMDETMGGLSRSYMYQSQCLASPRY